MSRLLVLHLICIVITILFICFFFFPRFAIYFVILLNSEMYDAHYLFRSGFSVICIFPFYILFILIHFSYFIPRFCCYCALNLSNHLLFCCFVPCEMKKFKKNEKQQNVYFPNFN